MYDPEIPDTINVATMIAGLEKRVNVSPQQPADPGFQGFPTVSMLIGVVLVIVLFARKKT